METILVIIVIVAILWYWANSKSSNLQSTKKEQEQGLVTTKVVTASETDLNYPDTGAISPSPDGGWILNPVSTFPLTIYGISESIAEELKKILDDGYTRGYYQVIQNIMPIVTRYNIRCKEIDDYIKEFKLIYLQNINDKIKTSSEWLTASDLDREDILTEFKEEAAMSLDIQPDCNLEVLFSEEQFDVTIDDALIDRFGYDAMRFYLSKKRGVHIIPADHYERKMFEKLTDIGLAVRGEAISLPLLLESLKLKELSALVADLNPPKFSRKAKAVEYLMNVHDIKERINRVVGFRTLFQINSLPDEFINIDINQISLAWQYAYEISSLICGTYAHAGYSTDHRNRHLNDLGDGNFIKGWEISIVNDSRCCPYCKRAASKKYSKNRYPAMPLHIGCRCSVLPIFKH